MKAVVDLIMKFGQIVMAQTGDDVNDANGCIYDEGDYLDEVSCDEVS